VSAPREIIDLVERFTRNEESYRSEKYNETGVRREFIDPFFKCLGWDIDNTSGFAEAYKDVIHEDAIKIGGMTKAPDYCFRIGGTRKFFLEAKRPSVNLKTDPEPAFQLRRYAWSAKLHRQDASCKKGRNTNRREGSASIISGTNSTVSS
jgi:predicted type IV restriction endonuclease